MLRSRINNPHFRGKTTTNLPIHSHAFHGKKSSFVKRCLSSLFLIGVMIFGLSSSWFVVIQRTNKPPLEEIPLTSPAKRSNHLSTAFDGLIERAKAQQTHCHDLTIAAKDQTEQTFETNGHTAHLSSFGFLRDLEKYVDGDDTNKKDKNYEWECILPPENECNESQFTVIFMAHNPDRLSKMINQIRVFQQDFNGMVKEVVVVWNGPSREELQNSPLGKELLQHPLVRIEYPLENGFPNDLFNRYHPRLEIQTKAILYYDDDGPFYSLQAIVGGFELWKRNANAQIGAMARKLDFSPRQMTEQELLMKTSSSSTASKINTDGGNDSSLSTTTTTATTADRFFISHCPADQIRYNYNEFAQFGAKMVLPSGSFLHSNYLACLWHPLFQPLRKYIQDHPVHPDDGTVSMIVAQISGRAPKVYSRRINQSKNNNDGAAAGATRRLFQEEVDADADDTDTDVVDNEDYGSNHHHEQRRRRLMDGINWDAPGAHAQKMDWGKLRSDVANSLGRYFGSINSGSLGWCYGTDYYQIKTQSCEPDQAKIGMIPWLNPDHTPKATCA